MHLHVYRYVCVFVGRGVCVCMCVREYGFLGKWHECLFHYGKPYCLVCPRKHHAKLKYNWHESDKFKEGTWNLSFWITFNIFHVRDTTTGQTRSIMLKIRILYISYGNECIRYCFCIILSWLALIASCNKSCVNVLS